jgi:hypothetical protein
VVENGGFWLFVGMGILVTILAVIVLSLGLTSQEMTFGLIAVGIGLIVASIAETQFRQLRNRIDDLERRLFGDEDE